MNFIVAAIFMNLQLEKYESVEESFGSTDPDIEQLTFWIFLHINFQKNWRDVFKMGTPRLKTLIKKLETRAKTELSEIYQHIQNNDVPPIVLPTHYLTLLALDRHVL